MINTAHLLKVERGYLEHREIAACACFILLWSPVGAAASWDALRKTGQSHANVIWDG